MVIPDASHPAWLDIIAGRSKPEFDFLAVRILLGRLSAEVAADSSPDKLRACAEELRNLFVESERLPSAQSDLNRIFGTGAVE